MVANHDTESLAYRLKSGDREAAAELVDLFYQPIFRFFRRRGHSPAISEDLCQEVFIQVWQHVGSLRENKAFRGWLYRIASNVSYLYWRKNKRKREENVEQLLEIAACGETSEKVYNDELRKLHRQIGKLPQKLQDVVILHYLQGLTIAEGAQALEIREGTFKSRLSRSLKLLRNELTQQEQ